MVGRCRVIVAGGLSSAGRCRVIGQRPRVDRHSPDIADLDRDGLCETCASEAPEYVGREDFGYFGDEALCGE
jgi:hypothetical protein